ncbi:hypothetical protein BGW39_009286, partial [Mortierella sp. 14UC]
MTFSGLPSIRDPKHSLKNSASSASSSPSSSPTSSPTSAKSVSSQQQIQQQQQQQSRVAVLGTEHPTTNVAQPFSTTTSIGEVRQGSTGSGAMMSVAAVANVLAEATAPTSIESSFQGLIQSSFGHVLSALPPSHSQAIKSPPVESGATVDLRQLQVQLPSPSPATAPHSLLPPMTTTNMPAPIPTMPAPTVTKKKATPQNLSPAHSAAYRKRLNVNQALLVNQQTTTAGDDPEPSVSSPASSIGKAKRARATNKDGRSRRVSKSYRGSSISSYHSSSYTSFSSDNDGSDEDEDENEDEAESTNGSKAGGESSVSPVVRSLTLAGLGLSGLGLGLGSLVPNLGLDARRGSDFQMASASSFGSSMASFQDSTMPQQMSLQDQEHLDRMQRIEMLLSNVIPGAAEFIASGSHSSLPLQQQQYQQQQRRASVVEKKELSFLTHNLGQQDQQSPHDRLLSPQERLANISLSSPSNNTTMTMSRFNSSSGLSSLREESEPAESISSSSSPLPLMFGPDYIERMKRIEMLLGTIQDVPLTKALISQSQGQSLSGGSSRSNSVDVTDSSKLSKKLSKKDQTKKGKADGRKSNYNSDGTIIKRPHVAAGFAGQKPPPKLPQAIAEAAQKKQATRKKRVSAAAAAKAATAAAAANSTSTMSPAVSMSLLGSPLSADQGPDGIRMDSRSMTISTTVSLEIPSTYNNESSPSSFSHRQRQQTQQQHQQRQQRMLGLQNQQQQQQMAQHRNSISRQPHTHVFNPYQQQQQQPQHQQQPPMSSVNSMSTPSVDSMSSYGSLVVPASSSTSSSPSSSPNLSRATAPMGQDSMIMSPDHQQQLHQLHQLHRHISLPQTQLLEDLEMSSFAVRQSGMSSSSDADVLQAANDTHGHPFAHPRQQPQPQPQQNHNHHSIQISQDGFADFGLKMDESLEGLMKKSMGSFDHLMESFSNESPSLMDLRHIHQHQQQQGQLTPSTPAAADQFLYFQNLQQAPPPQQQHFQQQQQHFQQQEEQQQQQKQQQLSQQGHMIFQEMSRMMWMPNHSGGASFSIPANPEFSWSSSSQPQHQQPQTPLQPQGTMQSINISANDSPQEELELDLGNFESEHVSLQQQQQQQQQLSAHASFQQQHQEQQRRHMEQQQQQYRVSIQRQHQQTFYIPQMQDDEDEEVENEEVKSMHLPDH